MCNGPKKYSPKTLLNQLPDNIKLHHEINKYVDYINISEYYVENLDIDSILKNIDYINIGDGFIIIDIKTEFLVPISYDHMPNISDIAFIVVAAMNNDLNLNIMLNSIDLDNSHMYDSDIENNTNVELYLKVIIDINSKFLINKISTDNIYFLHGLIMANCLLNSTIINNFNEDILIYGYINIWTLKYEM